MTATIELGDIPVDVVQKDIKNVHLSVYPPVGKVRITAPLHMTPETIRAFAISKLGWIRQEQRRLREQERETPREYLDRESHYVWGKRYLLALVERNETPRVALQHKSLVLQVRPGTNESKRQAVIARWYREQVRAAAVPLLEQWEPRVGVEVSRLFVQRMKTRWGSCSPRAGNIRLNSELAKKPPACLEYILVHEMVHMIERHHNDRFKALMDQLMPQWRARRDELNRIPLAHQEWSY